MSFLSRKVNQVKSAPRRSTAKSNAAELQAGGTKAQARGKRTGLTSAQRKQLRDRK